MKSSNLVQENLELEKLTPISVVGEGKEATEKWRKNVTVPAALVAAIVVSIAFAFLRQSGFFELKEPAPAARVVTAVTEKTISGSTFEGPYFATVSRVDGSFSYAKVNNGQIIEDRFAGEAELAYLNGKHGNVTEIAGLMSPFFTRRETSETVALVDRAITSITLPDGALLPVKVINGRISRGRLIGDFRLLMFSEQREIVGNFDSRGILTSVRIEPSIVPANPASTLVAKEVLKFFVAEQGQPDSRVLGLTTVSAQEAPAQVTSLPGVGTSPLVLVRRDEEEGVIRVEPQAGLAAAGPQGPPGSAGPTGATGATGPAGPTVDDGSITTSKLAEGAVTNSKLSQITEANKVAGQAVQLKTGGGLTTGSGLTLTTSCSSGQVLQWDGDSWECATVSGGGGLSASAAETITGGWTFNTAATTFTSSVALNGGLSSNANTNWDITGGVTRTLALLNSTASQVANFNLSDGSLLTGGTSRLTNAGALENITGLTVSSGTVSLPSGQIDNSELANSSITVSATAGTGVSVSGSPVSLGGTVTLAGIDASTSVKGVASFNSTNFSVSSGAVNTIQGISTAATPTFAALTFSNTTNQLVLGTTNTTTISSTAPSANRTATIPALTASDAFVFNDQSATLTNKTIAAGSNTISGLTNSNLSGSAGITNANLANSSITVSATAGTGISVSGSPVSLGGTVTLAGVDASTSVKGVASFNSTNFSVSSGAVNTIQNIATSSTPSFAGMTLTSGLTLSGGDTTFDITGGATRTLALLNSTASQVANFNLSDGSLLTGGTSRLTNAGALENITGLTVSSGTVSLPAGQIDNSELANSSITVSATAGTGISVSGSPVSLGGTVTLAGVDASTSVKGVASFNSTNFSVSSGAVNTIQGISTAATPTFAALTFSNTTNQLVLGTTNTTTISSTAPSANRTATIPALTASDSFVFNDQSATLTNKTISGASNTLSNIGNSSLSNSSLTITAGAGLTDGGSVSLGGTTTLNVGAGTGITANANDIAVNQDTAFAWTNSHTYTFVGTENLGITSDLAGTVNVVSITGTPSGSAGTTSGMTITQADSANTNGLDSGVVITNSDTNLAIGAAIKLTSAGGGFTSVIDNLGTLISGTELNILDSGVTYGELTDSGTLTVTTADINGGTIDGTTIGGSSAAAGTFTTLTANTSITRGTDTITDFTGNGLTVTSNALTINVPAATDALSSTTSSGSGLEVLSAGLALLQGCSDNQILKWIESTDTWDCATDNSGGTPALSSIGAASGSNTIGNNDHAQVWNWSLTTAAKTAFTFGESAASTNGAGSQYILAASTTTSSTAAPLKVVARGNTIIDTTAAGGVTIGNATAAQAVTIDAGTATINIGNSANAKTVNVGTGAAAQTVTLGSTNSTSTTTIASGTGGISIGTAAVAKSIDIGTGAAVNTLTIGSTNTTSMTTIQSGTGNINFQAAGTGTTGNVQVGAGGVGSATPDLLVLDVKSTSGDPTGTNGAMYYNSNTGKFRCFETSAWKNCDTTGSGTDLQQAASYGTDETGTSVTTTETQITSVSITPATTTGDVLTTALVTILSANNTDHTLTVTIERGGTSCTNATVLETNNVSVTSNNGALVGAFELSDVDVDPGASALTYRLCAVSTQADTLRLHSLVSTVIDTGADLAEVYTTEDPSIVAGDVVSLDPGLKAGVKKSSVAYDRNVAGVVATRPGIVIGGAEKEGVDALPVTLSGRVPVKVITENGPIKAGDYLTSSSTPGVAMKATKAGAIIGTAMTGFDGPGEGTVLVFVKNGSGNGGKIADLLPGLVEGDASRAVLTEFVNRAANQTLNQASPVDLSEIVTDRIAAGIEIITPKLTTQDITATGILAMVDSTGKETVRISADGNAIFMGTVKADILEARQIKGLEVLTDRIGSLEASVAGATTPATESGSQLSVADAVTSLFRSIVEFFGKVIFHGDIAFLGRPTFNKDTAGFAYVKAGSDAVEVVFEREYANQPVVTASINLVGGIGVNDVPGYAVYDLSTRGFKIRLSRATGSDLAFSWIALAVADAKRVTSDTVSPGGNPEYGLPPQEKPTVTLTPTVEATPSATPTEAASEETGQTATESAALAP